MDISGLGENIKKARKKIGISQTKFSKLVNLSYNYYSSIERGVKTPKLETFVRIAIALNATPSELLGDSVHNYETTQKEFQRDYLDVLNTEEYRFITDLVDTLSVNLKNLRDHTMQKEEYSDLSYLGENIKRARINLGMSQTKFCDRVNLSCSYYSTIEHGSKIPKLNTFLRITEALNVTPEELLSDSFEGYGKLMKAVFTNNNIEDLKESEYKLICEHVKLLSAHLASARQLKEENAG